MIMTKWMRRGVALIALAAGLAAPGVALAQTCAGVESRVNSATSQLQGAVTSHITTRTSAMVAQEIYQRQRLLSAMHVLVRQDAVSSEQVTNADRAANEALANVIIEQSVNDQMRQAVADYGSTGHNACQLVEQGRNVAAMYAAYGSARAQMAESIREQRTATNDAEFRERLAEWSELVANADDATIASVLNGDTDAAREFIAIVAGPPRPPVQAGTGSVRSQQDRVLAMRDDARNSAGVYVLADIAANQQLRTAMEDMSESWVADGGEEWASRMATENQRTVLLDTARIEAQNIAMSALELRQQVMEEFALASFALSYVDDLASRPAPVQQAGGVQ